MGKYCAAYGCSNSSKDKDKGISLHVFPKDPILRQKWAFAMKQKGIQALHLLLSVFYSLSTGGL